MKQSCLTLNPGDLAIFPTSLNSFRLCLRIIFSADFFYVTWFNDDDVYTFVYEITMDFDDVLIIPRI